MKTIYLSRHFLPVVITAHVPGDLHMDFIQGDCRRLTAKRLCLAAERMGKESVAFLALLGAIGEVAENGVYDGRTVADWYGLIGMTPPACDAENLEYSVCADCGRGYWYGVPEYRDVCFDCAHGPWYTPKYSSLQKT